MTVDRHITHSYQKIGRRGRADAAAFALEHGFSEGNPSPSWRRESRISWMAPRAHAAYDPRMLDQMLGSTTDHRAPVSDWRALARELGPGFAARASAHDASDAFVAQNYTELKAYAAFSAGVPLDLGG